MMHIDTYNAVMRLEDQFIAARSTSFGLELVMNASDRETIDEVTTIARNAGLKTKKLIVGKGSPDAEMHMTIR